MHCTSSGILRHGPWRGWLDSGVETLLFSSQASRCPENANLQHGQGAVCRLETRLVQRTDKTAEKRSTANGGCVSQWACRVRLQRKGEPGPWSNVERPVSWGRRQDHWPLHGERWCSSRSCVVRFKRWTWFRSLLRQTQPRRLHRELRHYSEGVHRWLQMGELPSAWRHLTWSHPCADDNGFVRSLTIFFREPNSFNSLSFRFC